MPGVGPGASWGAEGREGLSLQSFQSSRRNMAVSCCKGPARLVVRLLGKKQQGSLASLSRLVRKALPGSDFEMKKTSESRKVLEGCSEWREH